MIVQVNNLGDLDIGEVKILIQSIQPTLHEPMIGYQFLIFWIKPSNRIQRRILDQLDVKQQTV